MLLLTLILVVVGLTSCSTTEPDYVWQAGCGVDGCTMSAMHVHADMNHILVD